MVHKRDRRDRRPQRRRSRSSKVVSSNECRCPSGKTPFRSFTAAASAGRRLAEQAERPYRCRACGWVHLTRQTRAEYDRRRAEAEAQDDEERAA